MKPITLFFSIFLIILTPSFIQAQTFAEFDIEITNGSLTKSTQFEFSNSSGYTTDLNIGYDAGLALSDPPENPGDNILTTLGIYSLLVKDSLNRGIAFQIQTLPFDKLYNLDIQLGVNTPENDDLTFRVNNLVNIPEGIKLILEDRLLGKYIDLNNSEESYKTFLTRSESEVGRFFLHTTSDTTPPLGPGNVSNLYFPTNDINTSIIGNCGVDSESGSVIVTSYPENAFNNLYNHPIILDINGEFIIPNPNWNSGEYQIRLTCRDKVGNGPSNFIFNNFHIDTNAPSKPIINSLKVGNTEITGIGENNTTISLNVICTNAPVVINNGSWNCILDKDHKLKKGDLITATAIDSAGNSSVEFSQLVYGSSSNKKSIRKIIEVCKDNTAMNYSRFGKHNSSKCQYKSTIEDVKKIKRKPCSEKRHITNNIRLGDKDYNLGKLDNKVVMDVKILQEHINRLIGKNTQDYIIVDGVFGKNTERKTKDLQRYFNLILKKSNYLQIDGIIGPKTRKQINNSC